MSSLARSGSAGRFRLNFSFHSAARLLLKTCERDESQTPRQQVSGKRYEVRGMRQELGVHKSELEGFW